MLTEDHGLHLRRRALQIHRQQAAEAERVEQRAQADHAALGQREFLVGEVGEDVDRIGDDEHDRVGPQPLGLDLAEDRPEEDDVAVDERQPALVGFPPQAGGDADHVGVGKALVAPGTDHLVGDRRRSMHHVEGLAVGKIGIRVHDHDLVHEPAKLEREARRRADDPATADDPNLHVMVSWV